MADWIEKIGVGGAIGVATGALTGLGVGVYLWVDKVWKEAMVGSQMDEDAPYAKWLITFLGPGKAFLGVSMGVGALTVGCLCACIAACCGIDSSNDLTKDKIKEIIPDETLKLIKDRAPRIIKILEQTAESLKKGPHDEKIINNAVDSIYTHVADIINDSEQADIVKETFKDILTNQLSATNIEVLEKTHEQVKSHPIYVQIALSYLSSVQSKAYNLLGSFRSAPKVIEKTPSVEDEKRNTLTV